MAAKFSIAREYPFPASVVWADLIDFDALAESMEGAITYEGLPSGTPEAGASHTVRLKRWGWFPMGRWTMKVVERDDANRVMRSEEHGGPVRLYRHRLTVEPLTVTSCRYTDHCDVDAGWLTPLIAPQFRRMYERRHEMRRKRLEDANS
ncbi:MAG: SRPBCC family protein [Pseudomonadota bacterium]